MKKLVLLLFISILTFSSCGSSSSLKGSANTWNWYGVGMRPSQLSSDGSVFYRAQVDDEEYIEVYFDKSLSTDATYYYNQLWQQYGWSRNGDTWSASQYANRPNSAVLHISVKRGVAVYIYPESKFRVFRVVRKYD